MRDLKNFDLSTQKSQKYVFLKSSFQTKYILFFELNKSFFFMTLKSDPKFEEKLTCGLEKDMRNMANLYQSTRKSQNWDFDGILLILLTQALECLKTLHV